MYRQYVNDPYGNVISVKDGSGTPVDISNDSGFNNAYTYRGYRYDADTGLYYLNARYYGAGIGRFLTKDTWKGAGTNPQTLNRYAYAIGDPVNFIDHDGHRPDVTGGPEDISVYTKASGQPYKPVPSPSKEAKKQLNQTDSITLGMVATALDSKLDKFVKAGSYSKAVKLGAKIGPLAIAQFGLSIIKDVQSYSGNQFYAALLFSAAGVIATTAIVGLIPEETSLLVTFLGAYAISTGVDYIIGIGEDFTLKRRK